MTDYTSHVAYRILDKMERINNTGKYRNKKINVMGLIAQYFKNHYLLDQEMLGLRDELSEEKAALDDAGKTRSDEFYNIHNKMNLRADALALKYMINSDNMTAIKAWHDKLVIKKSEVTKKTTVDDININVDNEIVM